MNDRPTTAPAIIAIAMAIIRIAPLASFAPFSDLTIIVIIELNIETAVIPFAKLFISIKLSKTDTPANIAIAKDKARIVDATLPIVSLSPSFRVDTRDFINSVNPATKAAPFIISSSDSIPTNLHTPTNSRRETDILSTRPLSLANCCSSPTLAVLTRTFTNIANPAAKAAPLSISSADSKDASLQTPTIMAIAIVSLISIPPTFPTLSPALPATFVIALTKIANPAAKAAPFAISSPDNLEASLHTKTISSIATASFFIILPIPLTSPEYLEIPPTAARNAIIPTAITANPLKPFSASLGSIFPIILTVAARSRIAIPICKNVVCRPFTSRPDLFNVIED